MHIDLITNKSLSERHGFVPELGSCELTSSMLNELGIIRLRYSLPRYVQPQNSNLIYEIDKDKDHFPDLFTSIAIATKIPKELLLVKFIDDNDNELSCCKDNQAM